LCCLALKKPLPTPGNYRTVFILGFPAVSTFPEREVMTLAVALPRKSTVQIRFSRQSETAIAENSWDYLKVALVDSFTQHSSECVSWAKT